MQAHLLSSLARQFVLHGKRFGELHPNDWLVWEAGEWKVPRGNIATAITQSDGLKGLPSPRQPGNGDPLCFAMPPREEGKMIQVGRAEGNDFVLSDAGVSRHHCSLVFRSGSWLVMPADAHVVMALDGTKLAFGHWVAVANGQRLKLGHLEVSLYNAPGFMVRLAQLAKRATGRDPLAPEGKG